MGCSAMMYEPGVWVSRISPTELQLEACEKLHEPKRLQLYDAGHFDDYLEKFDITSGAVLDWFEEHLA